MISRAINHPESSLITHNLPPYRCIREQTLHSHPCFHAKSKEYAESISGRGSSSSSENKIKRKNNKNGEEMRSLCRFSRAIRSLPNSQSFWELYRKIQKRNGRLPFAIRILWDVASFGGRSSKALDKMALTKEDRSYGNSLFYGIRMLRSYFHSNFASKKRSLPLLLFSPIEERFENKELAR